MNQEKYELVITAEQVVSTDGRFNMDDLGAGNNYKTLDAYFKRADGQVIRRSYNKSEKRNTNQTMAISPGSVRSGMSWITSRSGIY